MEKKINIFCLDFNVQKCAEYHNSRHNIKMILEQHQLLCTAHRVLDGKLVIGKSSSGRAKKQMVLDDHRESMLYSVTHQNHPSAIWCRTTNSNYKWLHELTVALCKEYTYRYGKIHKCEQTGLLDLLKTPPNNIPIGEFTPVNPAMPTECIIPGDSVGSYRFYYRKYKRHLADWSGKVNSRPVPDWFLLNN